MIEQTITHSFTLQQFLLLGTLLFAIGLCGLVINRKNIITILMSIELMLLAVNLNLVATSIFLNNIAGQIFTLMILTVAAAEAAIGLAIIVAYHRNRRSIEITDINEMHG